MTEEPNIRRDLFAPNASEPRPPPRPRRSVPAEPLTLSAFERRVEALELAIASWGSEAHTQGDDCFIATAKTFLAWLEDRA